MATLPKVPKRPTSAYMAYFKSVHASHGSLSAAKASPIISKEWKAMDEAARQPYVQLAEQDKLRFEKEKEDYTKWLSKFMTKTNKKKRVPSSYAFFVKENFKDAQGDDLPEKSKFLGAKWKAMSDDDKKPYQLQREAAIEAAKVPPDVSHAPNDTGVEPGLA